MISWYPSVIAIFLLLTLSAGVSAESKKELQQKHIMMALTLIINQCSERAFLYVKVAETRQDKKTQAQAEELAQVYQMEQVKKGGLDKYPKLIQAYLNDATNAVNTLYAVPYGDDPMIVVAKAFADCGQGMLDGLLQARRQFKIDR